ncbi:MAG: LysM peptidoglycan-binding domain-containing protein, partial [Dehalococcoidia bacterium]
MQRIAIGRQRGLLIVRWLSSLKERRRSVIGSITGVSLLLAGVIFLFSLDHGTALANCDQPGADTVVVQTGDTLRSLARIYYGAESCAGLIAQQNSLENADDVFPGQMLILPSPSPEPRVRYSFGVSGGPRPTTPTPSPSPTAAPSTPVVTVSSLRGPVLSFAPTANPN